MGKRLMRRDKLNDLIVRRAKPIAGKAVTLKGDGAGLWLVINRRGSKYWLYRYMLRRKKHAMSFGPYPEVSLAQAREKRDAARKLKYDGIHPLAARRREQAAAKTASEHTFKLVAEQFVDERTKTWKSQSSAKALRSALTAY